MISTRNISLMYIIWFCRRLLFSIAITYLFYNHYGLWPTELFIVQSVFSIGMVFLEIPTGFISDKFSRKLSLVIWLLLSSIGFVVYSQGSNLLHFILSELILVLWYACFSGTDTAILYDSIAHDWDIKQYKKYSWRYNSIGSLAEAIGWIWGVYIGVYGLSIPFLLDGIFIFFAFIISLFLIEPPRTKIESQEWSWTQIRDILKWTYKHSKVFWLIIYSAVVSSITLSMVWFSQPYMKLVELPMVYFGRFWFSMNIWNSFMSLFLHRLEKYLTEKVFMIAIILRWIICMLMLAFFPYLWILPVFFNCLIRIFLH